MCQSKADGGVRCFSHEIFGRSPNEIKERIKSLKLRKKQGKKFTESDEQQLKELMRDYATTEEGIENLEEDGKEDIADKYSARRNRLIEAYNSEHGKAKPLFAEKALRGASREYTRHPRIWDINGFNVQQRQKRIHRETGNIWNPAGFDYNGTHKETGTRFHPMTGLTVDGYTKEGFHRKTGLDRQGFDRSGYNVSGWHKDKHTRPDANGLMFDYKGEAYPESDDSPDAWGWLFSTRTNDFMHEATGTSRNPDGLDYFQHGETKDANPASWYWWGE